MNTLNIATLGLSITGKGKAKRVLSFLALATGAYGMEGGRSAFIGNLAIALGDKPTDAELAAAKQEYVIGIAAFRMPVAELPKGRTSEADRLEYVRDLVCHYASPPEDGKEARPLRANQKGRRTPMQHKVIRNAEKNWSLIKGEAGYGEAQGQADKNAKQRAPQMAGSTERGGKAEAPKHSELITPEAPLTSDEYVQHMVVQLRALQAYDKKHAAKRPTTFSEFAEGLMALGRTCNTAANDYQLNKAKIAAMIADKAKQPT